MQRISLHGVLSGLMLATAAMFGAAAAAADLAPSVHPPPTAVAEEAAPSKAPSSVDAHDLERGRKQHAAAAEHKLELEQLRAEVNRLRVASEMCQAGVDKRMAVSAVPPSRSP